MKRSAALAATFVTILLAAPLLAQDWSLGAGTGAFVFGTFAERTLRAGTEQPGQSGSSVSLTAATRPGLSVDLERALGDRFAIRAEATFTDAPLKISSGGSGVSLGSGKLDVTTFMLPLVFRLNPRGTFRFHLLAGPAYAAYHLRRAGNASDTIPPFIGTRGRWGAAAGGGVDWWFSKRFAAEGQVTDISTPSPFRATEFAASSRVKIPRPHNVHTTVGLRLRF